MLTHHKRAPCASGSCTHAAHALLDVPPVVCLLPGTVKWSATAISWRTNTAVPGSLAPFPLSPKAVITRYRRYLR